MKRACPPWPRCTCGGPAAPSGPPALACTFDVETRSEANRRDRHARMKRVEAARDATIAAISVALAEGGALPEHGPWFVRLTRLAPKIIDDDNLGGALKSVRDAVAATLGTDDGSPAFGKRVEQEKRSTFGVRVEIWGPSARQVTLDDVLARST